jgi:hypothetical protein
MWNILPGTLYNWYRNHLSSYISDKVSGQWPSKSIKDLDVGTVEVVKDKPVYVFKPQNIGERMSIDDKSICHDGYTILVTPVQVK